MVETLYQQFAVRSYWQKNSPRKLSNWKSIVKREENRGPVLTQFKPRDVYLAQPNICLS